jgi:hypothetical protein
MVGDSRHRLPGLVSASRWEVVNLHQPAWLVQMERLPYCVFQGAIDGGWLMVRRAEARGT